MNDDAIAPVVAVMMILVVAVTLLSIWNAIYLPDLKQQAEMEHLKEVEEGFREIDSDISHMVSLLRNANISVNIPLGGGDILLHQARSGGSLNVQDSYHLIEISNSTPGFNRNSLMSKIQYLPTSNFWIKQGYSWEGYTAVSKGTAEIPLEFETLDEARITNYILINPDKTPREVIIANITKGTPATTSGNGIASVVMEGRSGETIELLPDPGVSGVFVDVNVSSSSGKLVNKSIENYAWEGGISHFTSPEGYSYARHNTTKPVSITLYNLTLSVR